MPETITRDVVIVGSGPIGCTFARFLAAFGREVTMIESGTQLSPRPGMHLQNNFHFQQEPNLFLTAFASALHTYSFPPVRVPINGAFNPPQGTRLNFENPDQLGLGMPLASAAHAVGGMFTHWTACAPDPVPMERSLLYTTAEWEDLLTIARRLFNVNNNKHPFEPSLTNKAVMSELLGTQRGPDKDGTVTPGHTFPVDNLPLAAEKRQFKEPLQTINPITWTGADTILGPLLDDRTRFTEKEFQILAEHRVEKLVGSASHIDHVEVRDLRDNEMTKVSASLFIVTGGPMLTPRLLWQSGIRSEDDGPLGRYLNSNTSVSARIALNEKLINKVKNDPNNTASGENIPIPLGDPDVMCGFDPTDGYPWHSQIERAGRYLTYDILDRWSPKTDVRLLLDLQWFGMVAPKSANRLVFSDTLKDRFGQPQITIVYNEGPTAKQRQEYMLQDLDAAAKVLGAYVYRRGQDGQPVPPGPVPDSPGSTLHYHGTTRMGDASADSVVNRNSKVWDYDNLYLGGVGVIDKPMASNPTLTACAIAVRSVAKIVNKTLKEIADECGAVL